MILDAYGHPIPTEQQKELQALRASMQEERGKFYAAKRMLRAKYDAAQTGTFNENHWANADRFDPHTVASLNVRQKLRSRSRYELIENNPFLKGTLLTICNDFVGSGPKLQITDERLPDDRKKVIESRFMEWADAVKLRQKLWRMRMAKIVDGESFAFTFLNKNRRRPHPVLLDFYIVEADRVTSYDVQVPSENSKIGEIDGVRFDQFEQPLAYHLLYHHPGGTNFFGTVYKNPGKWIEAGQVIHWFRQDRGWLRGIPEAAPSLPLCALLRRYTLSIVRHAEILADFTILLGTDNPAASNPITDGAGRQLVDDPFDLFPLEMGMMTNLPYGYKPFQLQSVPHGAAYDEFVGAILREITRPILAPYNISSGSSKDSNMASAVVDQEIYKGGQNAERNDAEHVVLDHMFELWFAEGSLIPGYFSGDLTLASDRTFKDKLPKHRWGWTKIGIDHTDPSKVAEALKVMHEQRFMTDEDIQTTYFNRDRKTWQESIKEDDQFRKTLEPVLPEPEPKVAPGGPAGAGGKGVPPKKKPAAKPKTPARK